MRPVQAVLLTGGLGTRLGELTKATPKPLLEVDGRPFVEYLIDELARFGFKEILLLCGYKADQFNYLIEKYQAKDVKVSISQEPDTLLGTGGALKFAADRLQDHFLLMNGDTIFDINYVSLVLPFEFQDTVARVALRKQSSVGRYGAIQLQGRKIVSFSSSSAADESYINGGIYYVKKDILNSITELPCSLERDVFEPLAASGQLEGFPYHSKFLDIGIPADFERASQFLNTLKVRPAAFLDRDGVLNVDKGYTHRSEDLVWIDGAPEAIRWLNDNGYYVFVVTNQAGVARGYYTCADVEKFHHYMNLRLSEFGAHIDAFEYCPYHEGGIVKEFTGSSNRRKPNPGMILDLLNAWPVDSENSFLIGDKESDLQAGNGAGIKAVLFNGEANLRNMIVEIAHKFDLYAKNAAIC
jgi:D,D-heptose 1,7-bisphosphate phosphatase